MKINTPKLSHTPGPWRVGSGGYGHAYAIYAGTPDGSGSYVSIADVNANAQGDDDTIDEANARLIAAAPEMAQQLGQAYRDEAELLQVIEELLAVYDDVFLCIPPSPAIDAAHALLAARRGEEAPGC